MNIVILGPPGAGKGTQAKYIAEKVKLDHISSGDLLRDEVRSQTELGLKAQEFMGKGALVPDSLVIDMIKKRISQGSGDFTGFLLDGFPRSVAQAKALKEMLLGIKKEVNLALNINVNDELILKRLSGRRVCSSCGTPYNIELNAPKENGKCDACQGELIQRDDDTIGTIRERLTAYKSYADPIISFYKNEGLLKEIDGNGSVGDVRADVDKALEGKQSDRD